MNRSIIALSALAAISTPVLADEALQSREITVVTAAPREGGARGNFQFKMNEEMEKVTFLGVGTNRAGETLADQLGLPRGVGLTVEFVTKDSPAEQAGIKQHDVLHKFNDQLLCNVEQLATLVRMNKPGDAVKVTLIRKGEPVEVSATLVEREMPKMDWTMLPGQLDNHLRKFKNLGGQHDFKFDVPPHVMGYFGEGHRSIIKRDDQRTINITIDGDERKVKVIDEKGQVVYDGPFNTDEEKAKVDAEIRMEIEKLESAPEMEREEVEPTTQPSN